MGDGGVHTFAQDCSLPAAAAARPPVLLSSRKARASWKLLQLATRASVWLRGKRLTVSGVDVTDLALRYGYQADFMNAILPAPQAEMQAATRNRSTWKPASPFMAIICPPRPRRPEGDQSFSTRAIRLLGNEAHPQ